MNVYSVYDKVAERYAEPFCMVAHEVAKRNFRFTLKKFDPYLIKDLELKVVGSFNETTGELVSCNSYIVDSGDAYLNELEAQKFNEKILKESQNEESGV